MKKEERIEKYGEEAYKKLEQQSWDWGKNHPKERREANHESNRKGGKYYEKKLKYFSTGLPRERNIVRQRHGHLYRPYKKIIAPDSQVHHEWIPETANYRGVALVEKEQHQYGYINVIQILEGGITLLTEEEIKNKS